MINCSPSYCHLSSLVLRQGRNLFIKQLLGLLPHSCRLAVLELNQARQEIRAERLARLPGQESGQVVNRDDRQFGLATSHPPDPSAQLTHSDHAAQGGSYVTSTETVGLVKVVLTE